MTIKPEKVSDYFKTGCGRCEFGGTPKCKVQSWKNQLQSLRKILKESELKEELKWGAPCYTYQGKNVLMLSALKESVVVSFFRGTELKDSKKILEKPGKNSRFARYFRCTEVEEVNKQRNALLAYIKEAIKLENSGKKTKASDEKLELPAELLEMFWKDSELKEAFFSLTKGRQRGYIIHFTSAKQSKTRTTRIEKCKPKILVRKGWNER